MPRQRSSNPAKRAKKRGKNLEKVKIIARSLLRGEALDDIHRGHRLVGNYAGRREFYIESGWLLIYKVDGKTIIGSVQDLSQNGERVDRSNPPPIAP